MKVRELLKHFKIEVDNEKEIKDIVTNTNDVEKNDLLICINGHNLNPVNLVTEDIKNKAVLILSDTKTAFSLYVENLKQITFEIMDYFYFHQEHPFKIIGVTGTEGKSSLCQILMQGLNNIKKSSLLISNELNNANTYLSTLTTPCNKDIIDAMLKAKAEKRQFLIMEVSCIALSEFRIDPKIFDFLFLTNLETDHLDYYQNIYHYHLSKISLFSKNIKGVKFIYQDTFEKYPHLFEKVTNIRIINQQLIRTKNNSLNHQVFIYKNMEYYTHLIFKQNQRNLVFLIELYRYLQITNIPRLIKHIYRIKGRLDLVHSRPYIMIDYAHSPKALENLLKEVSLFKQNNIVIVIGAGGTRDISKRKKYGDICLKYTDNIILTNDNPREENPLKIVKELFQKK